MSKLINPFQKPEEQKMPDMAFPLFATFPGQVAGQMNVVIQGGMTLRDYFAGQYLASNRQLLGEEFAFMNLIDEAYFIADRMIEERNKPQKS
jgi:hypothetical protein